MCRLTFDADWAMHVPGGLAMVTVPKENQTGCNPISNPAPNKILYAIEISHDQNPEHVVRGETIPWVDLNKIHQT
jgi:hypothetical protein